MARPLRYDITNEERVTQLILDLQNGKRHEDAADTLIAFQLLVARINHEFGLREAALNKQLDLERDAKTRHLRVRNALAARLAEKENNGPATLPR